MNKLLEGLNSQQAKAVQCTKGPLLVRAGAGSGKTRVLTRRIAYLIEHDDVPPEQILALTFTNKAANEMKHRIASLLGTKKSGVWAGTFHSLGIRILHRYARIIHYKPSFTIAGASTQRTITKHVIKDKLNLDPKNFNPKDVHERISGMKNELITPSDFLKALFHEHPLKDQIPQFQLNVYRTYKYYEKRLRDNQKMDFDDLLMLTVFLFEKEPRVLRRYQERFQYISVDEYQDTNHAQYIMIKLLAARYHNLCAVGDENQSIYGWRGADIRNIEDFSKDYPDAKTIYMEQNYRSTKSILGAADMVIKHNYLHLDKDKQPWTKDDKGAPVSYYRFLDADDEAHDILDIILKQCHQHRYHWNDFAILYRTNAQSNAFEQTFLHSQVPYQIVGGNQFLDRKEIQDTIAYLTLLVNPDDNISFRRIVNRPKRGIGAGTFRKLHRFAAKNSMGDLLACTVANLCSSLSSKQKTKLMKFGKMIIGSGNVAVSSNVVETMNYMLRRSDYIGALEREADKSNARASNPKTAKSRLQNIYEFIRLADGFDKKHQDLPKNELLTTFLNNVQLESAQDKISNRDSIKMMTVHAAKGLEYPIVFMVGMENGLFPSEDNFGTPNMREERRVCYVGMTRAKKKLYLTNALVRYMFGHKHYHRQSEFIKELKGYPIDLQKFYTPEQGIIVNRIIQRKERELERQKEFD